MKMMIVHNVCKVHNMYMISSKDMLTLCVRTTLGLCTTHYETGRNLYLENSISTASLMLFELSVIVYGRLGC